MIDFSTIVTLIATAALEFGSHFIPIADLFGKPRLPRLATYVWGVTVMGACYGAWAVGRECINGVQAALMFWQVAFAAGAGVFLGYALDWYLLNRRRLAALKQKLSEGAEREDMLMEQRNGPEERAS